jgi:hypothetical protein
MAEMGAGFGMLVLVVETITKIRRVFLVFFGNSRGMGRVTRVTGGGRRDLKADRRRHEAHRYVLTRFAAPQRGFSHHSRR